MTYTLEEMESMKKYEEKLAKNREYQRKWMAKKRQEDPEFYAKQKAYNAQKKKEKYAKDEEFRKKELEYNKAYIAKKKKEKEEYEQYLKEREMYQIEKYAEELKEIHKKEIKEIGEICTMSLDEAGSMTHGGYVERCQNCKLLDYGDRSTGTCQCDISVNFWGKHRKKEC